MSSIERDKKECYINRIIDNKLFSDPKLEKDVLSIVNKLNYKEIEILLKAFIDMKDQGYHDKLLDTGFR